MSARRPFRFWFITLVTALVAALTASLGLWQLDRAAQKRALEVGIAHQSTQLPLGNLDLLDLHDPADAVHRRVALNGQWVPGATVYLDNRPMGGRTGFIVLAALRLSGSERAVLVQRGWVPRDFLDRSRVPEHLLPAGDVRVMGRLAPPPSQLFELGNEAQGPIRQNVDVSALAGQWGVPLLGGVSVLQTGTEETDLLRDWPKFVGDEHKHLAYAAQWFAMCAIVVGLYLWYQIYLPLANRKRHGTAAR